MFIGEQDVEVPRRERRLRATWEGDQDGLIRFHQSMDARAVLNA